ncbi:MAG: T9SS type A sorting domain-containing protein [Ignavibacteriaceae bacterium]|nr:T9SS type A sorting domain-containing protein [Ignavibacteriaceae bacterium]
MAQIIQPDSVLQKAKSLFQSVERLDINSKSGLVNLVIYDVLGKEIKRLVSEYKQAGSYKINFDASALASGVYFYSLRANDFVSTKKMLLLK